MTQFEFGYEERTREFPTTESYDLEKGSITAVRVFEGPWANRQGFIFQKILKPARNVNDVTLLPGPEAYPEANISFARRVDLIGKGKSSNNGVDGMASWDRAQITVHYGTKSYNFNELGGDNSKDVENFQNGLYIEESIDGSVERLNIPKSDIQVEGVVVGGVDAQAITVVYLDIVLKQVNVIRPNWLDIQANLGKVNSKVFVTPSGFACDLETLRYDSPFGDTRVNIRNGSGALKDRPFPLPVWNLEHRFKYNRFKWNFIFHEGAWRRAKVVKDAERDLYEKHDLNTIFFGPKGSSNLNADDQDDLELALLTRDGRLNAGVDSDDPQLLDANADIQRILNSLGYRL